MHLVCMATSLCVQLNVAASMLTSIASLMGSQMYTLQWVLYISDKVHSIDFPLGVLYV